MATARERLLQALSAIISQPFSEEGKLALGRLLNSYRVQAKPGEVLDKDQTARDALAAKIIDAWKGTVPLERKSLSSIISSFRMQLKLGLGRGKTQESKSEHKSQSFGSASGGIFRTRIGENVAKHENAYFKDKHDKNREIQENVSIAGGPKQGSNARGQCPKCRSMGIVLARAYGGDDYHSCIYCGYQAYLKNSDPNFDLPLAAELLGGALNDPERDDDD